MTKYLGDIVYVPVFDCKSETKQGFPDPIPTKTPPFDCNFGTGEGVEYHISGYAAFYLTGWVMTSKGTTAPRIQPSIATGASTCKGAESDPSARCLMGWFLKDLLTEGEIMIPPPGGTPNYGITIAQPAG
jgi:hypothetical protein